MNQRFLNIGLTLASATLLFLVGCGGGESTPQAGAPEGSSAVENTDTRPAASGRPGRVVRVQTELITPGVFDDVVMVTGSVEAVHDAVISAQTGGTVTYVAPLGRSLAAGQSVARIDATLVEASLLQAEAGFEAAVAQMELSGDTFRRQEALFADSIISPLEFEGARTQYAQARAQVKQAEGMLNQAKRQVEFTRVRAPFAGEVETRFVEAGEQVGPGVPVARLVDTRRLKIRAGIPERYAGDIREGSSVEVDLSKYGIDDRTGRLTFVGSVIDTENRTFPVEVEISNTDGRGKPAMIGRVMVVRNRLEGAISVPQAAVIRDENGNSVYVISRSGGSARAERRMVQVGTTYDGRTVVTNGLKAGDELITAGQHSVSPGDAVVVIGDVAPDAAVSVR